MPEVIYQASDLASSKRVDFIRDARGGGARLRDKDGSSLVFLPEQNLNALKDFTHWSQRHLQLSKLLESNGLLSVAALGDLAWLRVFDGEDVRAFCDELHDVLMASISDNDPRSLHECVHAWRTTARQLEDPLRRSVLLASHSASDFVDATEPTADDS